MDKNTWADGFKRGQESIKRKNESGCCCMINENGDILESACQLHMEWRDEAYERAAKLVETARTLGCTTDGIEDAIRQLKEEPCKPQNP